MIGGHPCLCTCGGEKVVFGTCLLLMFLSVCSLVPPYILFTFFVPLVFLFYLPSSLFIFYPFSIALVHYTSFIPFLPFYTFFLFLSSLHLLSLLSSPIYYTSCIFLSLNVFQPYPFLFPPPSLSLFPVKLATRVC